GPQGGRGDRQAEQRRDRQGRKQAAQRRQRHGRGDQVGMAREHGRGGRTQQRRRGQLVGQQPARAGVRTQGPAVQAQGREQGGRGQADQRAPARRPLQRPDERAAERQNERGRQRQPLPGTGRVAREQGGHGCQTQDRQEVRAVEARVDLGRGEQQQGGG